MVGPIIVQPNNDLVVDGDVVVRDGGKTRTRLDTEGGLFVHNDAGKIVFQWEMPRSNLLCGGNGQDCDLVMFDKHATNLSNTAEAVFHLDSGRGVARIGGNRVGGRLICLDTLNQQTIFLDGTEADITAGANGKDGNVFVQNADNQATIHLNGASGTARFGGANQGGEIFVRNNNGENSIR